MNRGGKKFYITFIDDYSKYTRVYLLRIKDEVIKMFLTYKNEVENQLNKKIKRLRTYKGGEYESNDFNSFCRDHGVQHDTIPPYSPQSNGVAERKNKTLKEMVNAMLISSGALFVGEAMLLACYIQNIISFKKTGKTPYELWKGHVTNLKYIKVRGCFAKVTIPEPKRKRLGPRTVDCMFIGYAQNNAAYRFMVIK
ncbi:hypothetical protein Pint_29037 [Pistacia integerrima]|uniref:Uncharacterized protein n=1 Tax=Pistacia integerrima TaxID=434235 RepID=A0ACC0X2S8_9ROSI|nr:hypothetical protein Pint_29037 [Pistacia integerrima]